MYGTTATGWFGTLVKAAAVTGLIGIAAMGAAASAGAAPVRADVPALMNDPGCEAFGWRHPLCAGGAWDVGETASEEWGPADTPNPVIPNAEDAATFPGSPAGM